MMEVGRIFDFRGYLAHASGRGDLLLWIETPLQTAPGGEFYCRIGGSVFSRPIKIYGEDAEQAKALAYSVMRQKFAGKTVLDLAGNPIELPGMSTL